MLCSMCSHGTTKFVTCPGCKESFCRHIWIGSGHCTNGVCRGCHDRYCTPGGNTGPGRVFRPPTVEG